MTTTITDIDETAHADVAGHRVAVVLYTATWCLPCTALRNEIGASSLGRRATVAALDVDTHRGVAADLDIRVLPTVIVWRDNERAATHTGAINADGIAELVAKTAR